MDTAIHVENVSVTYAGKQAGYSLHHVNVDIPKHKITSIIGPSGCGKTTFLKSLNRLHDLTDGAVVEGKIIIDQEDINHPNQPVYELRKKIGLVAQRPYPLPTSIYQNVAAGPKLHAKRSKQELDEIVETCLRKTNLWEEVKDRLKRPAAELSIGQQQRLCLARTLAVEPEIILCDEVTSALDPISSEKIEALLLSLKDDYTIVMVSHVMRQARRLSDYIIFMYFGEVVETGDAKAFFENPQCERSRRYLSGAMAGL